MIDYIDSRYIENSIEEEIKRADHLIYVSLKYTRTCDVIKNVIHRLSNVFDFGIIEILEKEKKKNKIKSIPGSPLARVSLLEKLLKGKVKKYIALYMMLRKIERSEFIRRDEYRKNVALLVKDASIVVDMARLKELFEKTKEFVKFVREFEV
ncbi:MAG: hypothetical protein AB1571_00030 [Nanoarchaeota archaeon]